MNILYKIALIFLFVSTFVDVISQNISLKGKEYKQLYKLSVDTSNYSINTLKEILHQDKKVKTNKSLAILFDSFAVLGVVSGIIMMSNSNYKNPTANIIGGMSIASGVIYAAVSIPLWKATKKRKKQRDILIFNRKTKHSDK